nr:LysR family transcriptional regulator [Kitasatospora mediocidica]
MGIELHHLRGFLSVAEEMHFTRAAEKIHLTQPTLSRNIRKLEERMGVRLLDRNTRFVALTAAGARLQQELSFLLPRLEEALHPSAEEAVLRLGFSWGFPAHWPQRLMSGFEEETGTRVDLVRRDEKLAGLSRGEADVALLWGAVDTRDMHVVTLLEERQVAAVAKDSELGARRGLHWAEVPGLDHAVNAHSGMADFAQWPSGERPNVAALCTNFDEWLEAVASGRGLGLLPESVAERHAHPSISFLPVTGAPAVPLHMVAPRQGGHPMAGKLMSMALRVLARTAATEGERRC